MLKTNAARRFKIFFHKVTTKREVNQFLGTIKPFPKKVWKMTENKWLRSNAHFINIVEKTLVAPSSSNENAIFQSDDTNTVRKKSILLKISLILIYLKHQWKVANRNLGNLGNLGKLGKIIPSFLISKFSILSYSQNRKLGF